MNGRPRLLCSFGPVQRVMVFVWTRRGTASPGSPPSPQLSSKQVWSFLWKWWKSWNSRVSQTFPKLLMVHVMKSLKTLDVVMCMAIWGCPFPDFKDHKVATGFLEAGENPLFDGKMHGLTWSNRGSCPDKNIENLDLWFAFPAFPVHPSQNDMDPSAQQQQQPRSIDFGWETGYISIFLEKKR